MLNNFQLPFKFNLYLSTRITYIYISVFIKAKFHGTFFEKKNRFYKQFRPKSKNNIAVFEQYSQKIKDKCLRSLRGNPFTLGHPNTDQ